jgi:hypothetical protein
LPCFFFGHGGHGMKWGFFWWEGRTMKKILVCTLILVMIFPAYCFAQPWQEVLTEQRILEEILLILEDGVVGQEEITSFLEKMHVDGIITADDECLRYYSNISFIIIGLCQLDFSGSPLEIFFDLTLLGFGIYWIYINLIIGYECIRT